MSTEHTHDDCVQCLQKRVRELQAENHAIKEQAIDAEQSLLYAWRALNKIGVISINADTQAPTFAVSECCREWCEINRDGSRSCSKCGNGVAELPSIG